MTTNASATLYHRGHNADTRRVAWERTEIPDVLWQDERHVAAGSGGFHPADNTFILIPHLDVEVAPEDRIARGVLEDETPPGGALVVMGAVRVDYGSRSMHHWEVTAK